MRCKTESTLKFAVERLLVKRSVSGGPSVEGYLQRSKFLKHFPSAQAILTAAHCFWDEVNEKTKDVKSFRIMAGKTNRDYYVEDPGMQTFQVKDIHIPDGYFGAENEYSGDIAVVRLNTSIIYQTYIRPICIKHHKDADKVCLQERVGKFYSEVFSISVCPPWIERTSRRLGTQ